MNLVIPDRVEIDAETSPIVAAAKAIVITDEATHRSALEFGKRLAERKREIEAKFRDPKAAAHKAHKSITALETECLAPVEQAIAETKRKAIAYQTEQERRAAAERKRLEDEARAKAEAERLEAIKAAAESRSRLEDAALAEAAAMRDAGLRDDADALLDAIANEPDRASEIAAMPIDIAPVVVETNTAKVAGASTSARWVAEVVDLSAFLAYIGPRKQYHELVTVSTGGLNKLATSMRSMLHIPGVRVRQERSLRL